MRVAIDHFSHRDAVDYCIHIMLLNQFQDRIPMLERSMTRLGERQDRSGAEHLVDA